MKNLVLLVLLYVPVLGFSQEESLSQKFAVNSFVQNYNSGDYSAVFLMFSDQMKEALPLDKLSEFLESVNSQVGIIESKEFVGYEAENGATYKTKFEKAVLSLFISLDSNHKMNGLFIKEYAEETLSKTAIDNLSIEDSFLTKDQKDFIFRQAKFLPEQTQISIGFIENDEVRYFGLIRDNDSIKPIDNRKNLFEIGSITKVFTANILAFSVLENRINLDDNINGYLNLEVKNDIKISFKSLANHSSGLPRMPTNFDTEKLDTVNTVRVRHILVPYKGSVQSSPDIIRSKESAKQKATSLLGLIEWNRSDFANYVNLSSDKDISDENGEIEFSYFDGFVPEFRDFAFDNEIGSLGLIESRFGYHIIEILSKGDSQKVVNLRSLEDNPYKFYNKRDLEFYLENLLELNETGTGNYLYSNLGAGLLGYTLSEIYDLSYEKMFEKYIFLNYKMDNTTFGNEGVKKDLVVGRDSNGYTVSNWDFSALAPAGGLLSNVEDLSKYVLAQFRGSNPEFDLIRGKTLRIDDQRDMGLGWHIVNSMESSDKLYAHGGGTGGYTSSMLVDLKNQVGVVILSNVSSFNPNQNKIELLSYDLIKDMRKKHNTSN